jgi:hypothetical protein
MVRQAAIEAILERNPNAFRPKIQVSPILPNCFYCYSSIGPEPLSAAWKV